ncbi:serotriflin-like [Rhineura floridana]|uniref:serotriflin-like n=1 Tax=Rhineura floridana TaxID=261503 RepID=UPI002AC8601E|nr:serotriflin-like [Rhineura floridana]
MLLSILFLLLAAVPQQSLGQDKRKVEGKEQAVAQEEGTVMDLSATQQQEILDKFNAFRRGVQPTARNMLKMTWSEKAANSAKKWARKCIGKSSPLEERNVDGILCGESISQSNFIRTWPNVIQQWNSSGSTFIFGSKKIAPEKHFLGYTQIVWYNSHEVGCTFAHCPENEFPFFYMCRFCPLGNIEQQLPTPYKEGPSCGDCPAHCEDKLCTNPCKYADKSDQCAQLIDNFKCKMNWVQQQCNASCKCTTEIK